MRESIPPTYDSREGGPRYHVTTRIENRTVEFRKPLDDPFVRHTIHLGWRDLLRGLIRRRLEVTVLVDGDLDAVNDVLELDAHAHELAERQREQLLPDDQDPHVPYNRTVRNLADLIDPEVS